MLIERGFAALLMRRARSVPWAVVGVAALSSVACDMPANMNMECQWPAGVLTPRASEPGSASRDAAANRGTLAHRYLLRDIRIAEELAMRHADARGKLAADYMERRRGCEGRLFDELARHYGVDADDMSHARAELDEWRFDAAVLVPVVVCWLAATILVSRGIQQRFSSHAPGVVLVATLLGSLMLAWLTVVLGEIWGGIVEMSRLGNTHMAYRVARIGWRGHSREAFALAAVFSLVLLPFLIRVRQRRSRTSYTAEGG